MKMHMDDSEILISYRNAKNQSEQIGVLADLNCCSRPEMAQWLYDHGEHVDGRALRYVKKKAEETEQEQETIVEDWEPEELKELPEAKEGERLPMLTDEEIKSIVDFIESNLLDVIRNNPCFDSMKELANIMTALKKMKEEYGV